MSNELLGDDFRLFWDSDDSWTSPSWETIISIGDLGFDPAKEQVEIPIRIATKVYKSGRGDWTLSFTLNYDPDDTFCAAVVDAINNGTKIHLAIGDDDDIGEANIWEAWWMLAGPLDAALDTNASFDIEGKVHFDRGTGGDELPRYVAAS